MLSRLLSSDPWQKTVRAVASTALQGQPDFYGWLLTVLTVRRVCESSETFMASCVPRTSAGLVVGVTSEFRGANLVRGCVG